MIWQILFGLGVFLLGMSQLEKGIRALSSHSFRRWLTRSTGNALSSVTAGTITTAILQSSSMVSLLMLAFVGASVIPLYNAIGVVLGANLGTTFTGWIVTVIGFKLKLSSAAIPLAGIGTLIYVFSRDSSWLYRVGQLIMGFGFLLFGLGEMKQAVDTIPGLIDIKELQGHGLWLYLLVGVTISAVIQSSSATMMITLSALNANLIDIQSAAALIIGADLGTTSTTALGALKGHAVKKQLAFAHVIFNVIVDLAAFFILLPLLGKLLGLFNLSDSLFSLVAFHSLFNLMGLMIFIPFLKPYTRWIENFFNHSKDADHSTNLLNVPAEVTPVGLTAMSKAIIHLLQQAIKTNTQVFNLSNEEDLANHQKAYRQLKQFEGEVMVYSQELQQHSLSNAESHMLANLQEVVRNGVYSAKALKDAAADMMEFQELQQEKIQTILKESKTDVQRLYNDLSLLLADMANKLTTGSSSEYRELLHQLALKNQSLRLKNQEQVYHVFPNWVKDEIKLSTLLNLIQDIWYANQHLIEAIENLLDDSTLMPLN